MIVMSVSDPRNCPHSEPKSLLAGVLAVVVHLMFIALLVFGVSWKDHPPEGMMVDIWTELPKSVPGTGQNPSAAKAA
jgi:colicin import membrane protein